ncbi:unnamed protein product [Ambrosiozyma monospora]|uniref:Unnamed protein product n=1 Tax=Ambrosiozyma monospora TaxID=43982 RepID=A0ACB5SS34_AMBMO|nr:unnamed protein product [Ambrosiozyma monospora]
MSTKVISWTYLFRKQLDGVLGKTIPKYWVPLYTMVSFRSDIHYADCIKNEQRQKKILRGVEFSLLTAGAVGLAAFLSRRLK